MPMKKKCLEEGCIRERGLAPGPVCAPNQCLQCGPYTRTPPQKAEKMTEKEALEIIKSRQGSIKCDYRHPEWSDTADRDVWFLVCLWMEEEPWRGTEGGGDTLVVATQMALEGIVRMEAKAS